MELCEKVLELETMITAHIAKCDEKDKQLDHVSKLVDSHEKTINQFNGGWLMLCVLFAVLNFMSTIAIAFWR